MRTILLPHDYFGLFTVFWSLNRTSQYMTVPKNHIPALFDFCFCNFVSSELSDGKIHRKIGGKKNWGKKENSIILVVLSY